MFLSTIASASIDLYKQKADKLNLASDKYWHILLHFDNGKSEVDDAAFFFAKNGNVNPKAELNATLDALYNETRFDDNSTACRFPARKDWLIEKLSLKNLPQVECKQYEIILNKLKPISATLVFPSAHINSPASMFGHTLLRINSTYNSSLLSYAVNYAADADPSKENAAIFAVKGLFGGYFGNYSLLPYYEKLKEYRDAEQRDVWEYNLNLSEAETKRMLKHIWELNGTQSYYYFFTKNCSYNILWFMEAARPSINLRKHFSFEVVPLETVHVAKEEGLIDGVNYRPSKRATLLKYEELLEGENLYLPRKIVEQNYPLESLMKDTSISKIQKQYILEASIEYLEFSYKHNDMNKEDYLSIFHKLSKLRATLGQNKPLEFIEPHNPIDGHRAYRVSAGTGVRAGEFTGFLGLRPAYHDLEDSAYGFLRGTQIEFLNFEMSYNKRNDIEVEDATLISIVSLAQRSEFFDSLSWRTQVGWDRDYFKDDKANFVLTLGAGYSWGDENGYLYMLVDPFTYIHNGFELGIGGSLGVVIDKNDVISVNIEGTSRYYMSKGTQYLANLSLNFRVSQNIELKVKYKYIDRLFIDEKQDEQTSKLMLNYYF